MEKSDYLCHHLGGGGGGGGFTKPFFNDRQMTKISDKSADNKSEGRISVAYNKNCHSSLMTSFVKRPPGEMKPPDSSCDLGKA